MLATHQTGGAFYGIGIKCLSQMLQAPQVPEDVFDILNLRSQIAIVVDRVLSHDDN
jgi:hypothetical protein